MRERRLVWVACLVLSVSLAAVLAGCSGGDDETPAIEVGTGTPVFRGIRQVPPLVLPDVTLTAGTGDAVRLRDTGGGQLRLMYLGYTNCPDACPVEMARISKALETLPATVRGRVAVQFVTTDPERDTPEALRTWLSGFGPEFEGYTGEQEALNALQRSFGLNPASHGDHGNGDYTVDHSTFVMLFAPGEQESRLVYGEGTPSADYAADISRIIEQGDRP